MHMSYHCMPYKSPFSCKEFIVLLRCLLWSIQINRQHPIWNFKIASITEFFFNAHIWLNLYQDIEYLTSFFTKIAFILKCTLPYLIVRKGGKDWGSKFHFWTNFTIHFTMLWLHFYKSLTQKIPSPFPRI